MKNRSAHLNMADRENDEVRDVGVERKGDDEDDAKGRVECRGFDDHSGSDLVMMDVLFADDFSHFCSDRIEAAGDEEGVDDGQSDFDAEICELGIDVVKDGTARFGEDEDRHG